MELIGLAKRFGRHCVLEPLDLTIAEGEFFTIVGPSGCGKSTLLNMIAGIERPSAGRIEFDGGRVDRLAPGERDVAMVFQSYALYPHLNVRENIGFPLRARRVARDKVEAEVGRVAARLGISDLLDRRPAALSGGQRQRVALGRALVRRPRVFLMDEPLSNLDARLRLTMRDELKRLHAEYRITTLYVTHDQEEALALSSRIAVLNDGRLQQCGTPLRIYEDPANLFVAGFVGSPPINLIDASLLRREHLAVPPVGTPVPELVAGVRPADAWIHPAPGPGRVELAVALTQSTGSDLWVVGDWCGTTLRGRAVRDFVPGPGESAWLDLAAASIFWFDRRNGERVRP